MDEHSPKFSQERKKPPPPVVASLENDPERLGTEFCIASSETVCLDTRLDSSRFFESGCAYFLKFSAVGFCINTDDPTSHAR